SVKKRVVQPKEIDDILVNPGIGFETFHRFNGDKEVRNYPMCSIAYFRFYWDQVEPEEGRYAFDKIEALLEKAREHGQDLALRFAPMDTDPHVPAGYRAKAKGFSFATKHPSWHPKAGQEAQTWAPDFNDPYFLARQEALVQAFGERFNGHPDLIRMDIGSMGRWGEWHTSETPVPMPTEENALKVIDWYLKYWNKTPLSMLIGYVPGLRYAVKKGAGWRADSLGDYGHWGDKWCHMVNSYPRRLAEADAFEAWRRGPVTFEPPGTMEDLERYVPTKGRGYGRMWDQALAWGASSYNAKSNPIPDVQVGPMNRFLKRCGYRFVLRSLQHEAMTQVG
ncbi:MAG: beta-galactosidase, partial [Candidatus Micrarchaeota archaeon]